MKTIGIKDLQKNPAVLTRSLEANQYAMITKRSKPIGLAISFNEKIIDKGLKTALMIDAYQKGYLSLGQLAQSLNIKKQKALKMLSLMGIDSIDYDFADDMKFMDSFV
ncbi:MAG TPA: type II toxin-antitoxin system Phd/YefM family antitoxin [Leucothrix mucor]|nr:type II toxin-antitoxin system Phd/YefM family antitoxin [Leucothrix mucor]